MHKIILITLLFITAKTFSQTEYKSDYSNYSITLDSKWIKIPDDIFTTKIIKMYGEDSKLKYEAGFNLKLNDYFSTPFILMQDLGANALPFDSVRNVLGKNKIVLPADTTLGVLYSQLYFADDSQIISDEGRKILYTVIDIDYPGMMPMKGLAATMLNSDYMFQINYYSPIEGFEENLVEFLMTVKGVKYETED